MCIGKLTTNTHIVESTDVLWLKGSLFLQVNMIFTCSAQQNLNVLPWDVSAVTFQKGLISTWKSHAGVLVIAQLLAETTVISRRRKGDLLLIE